ncbi:chorismate--pyruvate lyase family protein [Shewanella salipaludis]|uniref:Probable chorismate pyruvate-lyase n=1 Tax=Shewanella salipaludis TaxID=2723052 RepID=A0A972G2C6_9GAMM|nr:chorismate lyase [Shewanella salipaludis]NMH66211.1 chorismate lyase [Shewanella salipaludis]
MNVTSLSFPYGGSIRWFSPNGQSQLPPSPLRDWLLDTGSLTKRLKACGGRFDVRVLGEGLLNTVDEEFPQHPQVWVREVLLSLDHVPWVFARTLIPAELMSLKGDDFMGLGNRPLGELLYSSDAFIPGRIQLARVDICSKLALLAQSMTQGEPQPLWGRRRYFAYGGHELIVGEIFLPAAEAAIAKL